MSEHLLDFLWDDENPALSQYIPGMSHEHFLAGSGGERVSVEDGGNVFGRSLSDFATVPPTDLQNTDTNHVCDTAFHGC